MKFKIALILALLFGSVSATEEIRIYLSTTSPLEPVYIGKIQNDQSLGSDYLAQLESVMLFDFNFNGTNKVLAVNTDREKLLQQPNPACYNSAAWKNTGAAYVVKSVVNNQTLSIAVFSSQTGSLKQFPEIKLTGTLAKDRRSIHRLADGIFKALYGTDGVANTRILYSIKQESKDKWVSEIWSCDWDGANAQQLTKEGSYCVTPVQIPTSNGFLYVSYKLGQPKIFISSQSEPQGKKLIELRGNQLLPAISRQRDKLAFICDAAGSADLFLQEFNPKGGSGKPIQLFSYPHSTQASPTFSPDGSKIAFVSDKDGSPRIYIIPAVHTPKRATPHLITKQNKENSCPAWSPDGKKLAYSAKTKGTRQIWIYDFETGDEWQLTDGTGNKENPSWAQDSKHLVFNSTDGHVSELYLVNLNQPDVVKISQGPGVKHYPTWGTH
jgi:TolB protein